MTTYTNIFNGMQVLPANNSYLSLTLVSNVTLFWSAQFQDNPLVVAEIIDVNATLPALTVTLPDATQTSVGQAILFTNVGGANSYNILNASGGLIVSMPIGSARTLYLIDNTTVAGQWRTLATPGAPSVTSIAATSSTPNIVIGGSPITSSGTFTFALGADLASITSFGASTGYVVRSAVNTFVLRSLIGTANQITVTNGSGVAGNTTISLPTTITGIGSLSVGNLNLSANTISATNLNGSVILAPEQTGPTPGETVSSGNVSIKTGRALKLYNSTDTNFTSLTAGALTGNIPYIMPANNPIQFQVLQSVSAASPWQLGWATINTFGGPSQVHAIARFHDVNGTLEDSSVFLDDLGNISNINSLLLLNGLSIGAVTGNTISTSSNNNLVLQPNGTGEVRSVNNLSIENGHTLKMFATASAVNYFSLSASPALATPLSWVLPDTIPAPGQVIKVIAGNQLGYGTVSSFTGSSTINAVAKYSDNVGTIQDSGVIIDGVNNVTGVNSLRAGTINLALNTVSSLAASPLGLLPAVTQEVQVGAPGAARNFNIQNAGLLKLYNPGSTFFFGLQAPALAADVSLVLPTVAPTALQALRLQAGSQLEWANVAAFSGSSTINHVAKFSNTTGSIVDSGVIIDGSNNVTGAASLVAGNIQISTVANTITSSLANGGINISATGTGLLILSSGNAGTQEVVSAQPMSISTANPLKLYNSGNTQAIGLKSPTALAASYTVELPTALPATGQILQISTGGASATSTWATKLATNGNLLINASFIFWQRNLTINSTSSPYINNNGTYSADMWPIQSDGNNIATYSRIAGPYNTGFDSPYACRMTVVTANKKFGIAQFIENKFALQITGQTVSLSFAARSATLVNIRAAIIGWTGAADAVTNPISTAGTWGAAGTNPTLVANWAYLSTPSNLALTTSFVQYKIENVAISAASLTNLGVFIWLDDTNAAAAATLDIGSVKLENSVSATPFCPMPLSADLSSCQRYFAKDLPVDTALLTTATFNGSAVCASGGVSAILGIPNIPNNFTYYRFQFPVYMRTTPATIVTYPVTTTTNSSRCSLSTGVDQGANSAVVGIKDEFGFAVSNTSGAFNPGAAGYLLVHYYADASL